MDPFACLIEARLHLLRGERSAARYYLLEYQEWRTKRGYQPTLYIHSAGERDFELIFGDEYARMIRSNLKRSSSKFPRALREEPLPPKANQQKEEDGNETTRDDLYHVDHSR